MLEHHHRCDEKGRRQRSRNIACETLRHKESKASKCIENTCNRKLNPDGFWNYSLLTYGVNFRKILITKKGKVIETLMTNTRKIG
jgi:hypothetical protein